MTIRSEDHTAHPQRVYLFGSQAISPDAASLHTLHTAITKTERHSWLLETIQELPEYWRDFETQFPKYRAEESVLSLRQFGQWARTGAIDLDLARLPNIILSPLVVIIHLAEYSQYLEKAALENVQDYAPQTETLGFCTGFLSAVAVSLSTEVDQLKTFGATAIRLAMILGGIVDAHDLSNPWGPSRSFATAWTPKEPASTLENVLARYPDAYVSVSYDERRATVTTGNKTAKALQQTLRDAGVVASDLSLRGRFHSPDYVENIDDVIKYCDNHSGLSLPDASALTIPTRSNAGQGRLVTRGRLHTHALRIILVEHSQWYKTFQALVSGSGSKRLSVIGFGPDRCVPPTFASQIDSMQAAPLRADIQEGIGSRPYGENDIAVIGMSIKVAGADDVADFWDLLRYGQSQHKEVPRERLSFDTAWRGEETSRKWFGNFIEDHDAFDQKFFKKSAREAASMDPQQRQLLQTAYQALEQAGYFSTAEADRERNIGCYVGVCSADYEYNVACHQPNAFTAIGNLKSFIAGKISHYFGWTGPGLCIDTACSSSLVAVHLACKSILSGECNTALAGGVNVMTNPLWFQNLAAASFLSPTGQCKPFDASADGYCRGEGIAAVVLKKLSAALADGDQIIGSIPSTGVLQNQNCTPIFVPNAPSLSDLFRRVLSSSKLQPSDIQYVEAHGTGTQVGDPAEYDSIRQVLGGPGRGKPLIMGSTKGLVGHTECTSGAVSLVKTLLMVQQKEMPPQSSFSKPNPHLNMLASDNMEIGTKLKTWDDDFRVALINNYGASGSNASMIVTQAPDQSPKIVAHPSDNKIEYPLRFCGKDIRALKQYAGKFRKSILQMSNHLDWNLSNISFNACRQSNPSLEQTWILSCRSKNQLLEKLAAFEEGNIEVGSIVQPSIRPVIMCFGGQISTHVGLSRDVYEKTAILRQYLGDCDKACQRIGCESIFPGIFDRNPVTDPVKLQTMLFSMQYACAKSWMACGIQPVAVVGHSFGELTSLCVAGVLSLSDAVSMIAGRAKVIREFWGSEKGSMVATEADLAQVKELLSEASLACKTAGEVAPTIACFNGARSFTLAGTSRAINLTTEIMSQRMMRFKVLNVTNAFHSTLVESLKPNLREIGQSLTFNRPTIEVERTTEFQSSDQPSPDYVADHMRDPVYFNHAVQRLAQKYPSAIWLEAGSNSTITNMAARALDSPKEALFQPVNITNDNGLHSLNNVTMNLWNAGLSATTFWLHHRAQTYDYAPIVLPSYQFEKSRHWMEYKPPATLQAAHVEHTSDEVAKELWSFAEFLDDKKRSARFRINTMTEEYHELVSGHVIAETAPICPATLQVDIAIEATKTLLQDVTASALQPRILDVENLAPICLDPSRRVSLCVRSYGDAGRAWDWWVESETPGARSPTTHTTGKIAFAPSDDAEWRKEFAGYSRLVEHGRCMELLNCDDADDIIQGRQVYKAFSEAVDYPAMYQGVKKIVGRGNESAGKVTKRYNPKTWLDPLLSDCFSQVGGLWVNCMTEKKPSDMYIAAGFDKWMRSPALVADCHRPETWDVFAIHHPETDNSWQTDIFIFDPSKGELMEVILGIKYHGVSKASMSKILSRLSAGVKEAPQTTALSLHGEESKVNPKSGESSVDVEAREDSAKKSKSGGQDAQVSEITKKIRDLLAEISGLEPDEIKPHAQLADIGIDSLMGMELARELEGLFKCSLPSEQLMEVVDFNQLVHLVQTTLGLEVSDSDSDSDNSVGSEGASSTDISVDSHYATTDYSTVGTSKHDVDGKVASLGPTSSTSATPALNLPPSAVMEAFEESRKLTDKFITEYRCAGYMDQVLPRQTQLCIALAIEAFEQLGCSIRTAVTGQELSRIAHIPEQGRLAKYLYDMLEHAARLIDTDKSRVVRTAVSVQAYKSSDVIIDELLRDFPDHDWANRLTCFAGKRLADVLTGKCDGIQLIFGSDEGRRLVTGLYGDSLLNKLANVQMQDIIARVASKMPKNQGPLRILELGAGTGGTTKGMVALLAKLNVQVEYTFTDLSGSFVAAARKTFKEYPFMKFRVHDIEKTPANDLLGSQHIIIGSNAIHATRSLQKSVTEIRKALRPDGFLMMLEMTKPLYWVDIIFGLFEGWWLFEGGRNHAIAHESVWERDLKSAGYAHVDWTDGQSPEAEIQRVIIALASGRDYKRQALAPPVVDVQSTAPSAARRATVDEYIATHTKDFVGPVRSNPTSTSHGDTPMTVLITGASGSLGTHLVAHIAALPNVASVICLNRRSNTRADIRQQRAMEDRGILIDAACQARLQVIQTDTSKHNLGLSTFEYGNLVNSVTHIVHNAWPMSGKRPLSAMDSQFTVMRNLVDLANDVACQRPSASKVGFQFISSIAVVGHHGLGQNSHGSGPVVVPEEQVTLDDVLPNGYGEAKFICEKILEATLQKFPDHFRAMSVRLGQVAGSRISAYWNPIEHLAFLFKSSQTLKTLPAFQGELCWTPAEDVAGTLADLLVSKQDNYSVYHIDNPVRQPWSKMIPVLAGLLGVPSAGIVPFAEWVRRVRSFPGATDVDNPAARLIDFLDDNFVRMSCGGMLLGTEHSCEHSATLAAVGPVSDETVGRYIQSWKTSGFLK
ncbi:putative Polyketide synthase [Seiridium cardinale]